MCRVIPFIKERANNHDICILSSVQTSRFLYRLFLYYTLSKSIHIISSFHIPWMCISSSVSSVTSFPLHIVSNCLAILRFSVWYKASIFFHRFSLPCPWTWESHQRLFVFFYFVLLFASFTQLDSKVCWAAVCLGTRGTAVRGRPQRILELCMHIIDTNG